MYLHFVLVEGIAGDIVDYAAANASAYSRATKWYAIKSLGS